ncbi:hypothetical protein HNY73_007444 [Argiope bruennichi]|uniref:Uncharacterized protein n=1 Tax=Argiope bruennichi TaxID=94029 RepID=A0A8T0FEW1_ARGBR|nr:hypothetical protein HNY73_007444 [Argiope bruennichi]
MVSRSRELVGVSLAWLALNSVSPVMGRKRRQKNTSPAMGCRRRSRRQARNTAKNAGGQRRPRRIPKEQEKIVSDAKFK